MTNFILSLIFLFKCENKCNNEIWNLTLTDPTIFCILKSLKTTEKPKLLIILPNFLHACLALFSFFAPKQTIFPFEKIRAVVFGSLNFHNDCRKPFWIIFSIC